VLEDDGSRRKRRASAATAFSSSLLLPLLLLTHNTIRRLRLLRWILKDLPEIITFSFSFIFILLLLFQGGVDGYARARARAGVCVHHVCAVPVCTRMRACVRVRVRVRVSFQVELGRAWVGLDAWKPWTTLGRLVGFPPRLSARIEAHRHGSNVGTTAAA